MPDNTMIIPAMPDRWPDLAALFESDPEASGCWCMWWRKTRQAMQQDGVSGNRADLEALVKAGPPPGLLAYVDGHVAGWCAVAPRSEYASLNRSRTLKRVDDQPVWAITCFVIAKAYRRQGLSVALAKEAVRWAAAQGATIVEAYPMDDHAAQQVSAKENYMGYAEMYHRLGFVQVSERSERRNVWRKALS